MCAVLLWRGEVKDDSEVFRLNWKDGIHIFEMRKSERGGLTGPRPDTLCLKCLLDPQGQTTAGSWVHKSTARERAGLMARIWEALVSRGCRKPLDWERSPKISPRLARGALTRCRGLGDPGPTLSTSPGGEGETGSVVWRNQRREGFQRRGEELCQPRKASKMR